MRLLVKAMECLGFPNNGYFFAFDWNRFVPKDARNKNWWVDWDFERREIWIRCWAGTKKRTQQVWHDLGLSSFCLSMTLDDHQTLRYLEGEFSGRVRRAFWIERVFDMPESDAKIPLATAKAIRKIETDTSLAYVLKKDPHLVEPMAVLGLSYEEQKAAVEIDRSVYQKIPCTLRHSELVEEYGAQ